jgi:hypothetical protein
LFDIYLLPDFIVRLIRLSYFVSRAAQQKDFNRDKSRNLWHVGPFLVAGPIMAAFAGAGVGGVAGGLAGTLIGAGIPEYEAKRYEGRIRKGGILLSVHCDNSEWASKAKDILENTGADDVSSTSEASADFARSDKPMPRSQV